MILKRFPAGPVLALFVLAGCSGSAVGPDSVAGSLIRGTNADPVVIEPEQLLAAQNCPVITVREGTQQLRQYARGREGDDNGLEFQAVIEDSSRECVYANDLMTLKIGVRGRVLLGAAGQSFSGNLPIRIAIVRSGESEVLYSNLRRTPVSVGPPNASARFGFVETDIVVRANPNDRSLRILVGFDEFAESASR